jgi:hypothetical protein
MLRRKRKLSVHSVLENLKEEDLRSLCSEAVLERGFDYYRQKRVLHPIIGNDHMRAEVAGSSYEPYRVEIRAKGSNIKDLSISCTCPYEDGVCKHAIALLYTWIRAPSSFSSIKLLDVNLERLSKEQLLNILRKLFEEEPSLISIIKFHSDIELGEPGDTARIRNELDEIFGGYVDYKSVTGLIRKLNWVNQIAEELASKGNYEKAGTICSLIVQKCAKEGGIVDDSDGSLGEFLDGVVTLYGECVKATMDTEDKKKQFLDSSLSLYLNEATAYEDCVEDLIVTVFKHDLAYLERFLLERLEEELDPRSRPHGRQERVRRLETILLGVYEKRGDYQGYVSLCRRRLSDYSQMHLVEKLKELERYEDALQVCDQEIKAGKDRGYFHKERNMLFEKLMTRNRK